jgi:hypothetical protein
VLIASVRLVRNALAVRRERRVSLPFSAPIPRPATSKTPRPCWCSATPPPRRGEDQLFGLRGVLEETLRTSACGTNIRRQPADALPVRLTLHEALDVRPAAAHLVAAKG